MRPRCPAERWRGCRHSISALHLGYISAQADYTSGASSALTAYAMNHGGRSGTYFRGRLLMRIWKRFEGVGIAAERRSYDLPIDSSITQAVGAGRAVISGSCVAISARSDRLNHLELSRDRRSCTRRRSRATNRTTRANSSSSGRSRGATTRRGSACSCTR